MPATERVPCLTTYDIRWQDKLMEAGKERPGAADSHLQASKDLATAYHAYIQSCEGVEPSSSTTLQYLLRHELL